MNLIKGNCTNNYLFEKYIINWYYEESDEDINEKGEYFSSFPEVPFNLIMIPD
jgi:hypothetical protein